MPIISQIRNKRLFSQRGKWRAHKGLYQGLEMNNSFDLEMTLLNLYNTFEND